MAVDYNEKCGVTSATNLDALSAALRDLYRHAEGENLRISSLDSARRVWEEAGRGVGDAATHLPRTSNALLAVWRSGPDSGVFDQKVQKSTASLRAAHESIAGGGGEGGGVVAILDQVTQTIAAMFKEAGVVKTAAEQQIESARMLAAAHSFATEGTTPATEFERQYLEQCKDAVRPLGVMLNALGMLYTSSGQRITSAASALRWDGPGAGGKVNPGGATPRVASAGPSAAGPAGADPAAADLAAAAPGGIPGDAAAPGGGAGAAEDMAAAGGPGGAATGAGPGGTGGLPTAPGGGTGLAGSTGLPTLPKLPTGLPNLPNVPTTPGGLPLPTPGAVPLPPIGPGLNGLGHPPKSKLPPLPPLGKSGVGGLGGGGLGGGGLGGGRLGGGGLGGGNLGGGGLGSSRGGGDLGVGRAGTDQPIARAGNQSSSPAQPGVGRPPAAPSSLTSTPGNAGAGMPGGAPPPMMPPGAMGAGGGGGRGAKPGAGAIRPANRKRKGLDDETPGVPAGLRGKSGRAVPGAFPAPPVTTRRRKDERDRPAETLQLLDEELWTVENAEAAERQKRVGRLAT